MPNLTISTKVPRGSDYFPDHKAKATEALGDNPQCLSTLLEPVPNSGLDQITTIWAAEPPLAKLP